jgi:hypothetical protein
MNACTRRVIAILCAISVTPTAFLCFPWIFATAQSLFELLIHLENTGTPGHIADRNTWIFTYSTALFLYLTGFIAYWGLFAVGFNLLRKPWELLIWICAIITGFGMALHNWNSVGPSTDRSFVSMIIYIPLVVAFFSIVSFVLRLMQNTAEQDAAANP